MLKSEQIEADLKAEIAEAGRTITDPKLLAKWRTEFGLDTFTTIAAACDVPTQIVQNKMNASSPYRTLPSTGPESYAALSLPLTPENYPGGGPDWERWKPWTLLVARLSAALDASEDFWGDLYRRHKGVDPDAAGLTWWKDDTEKRFVAGIE